MIGALSQATPTMGRVTMRSPQEPRPASIREGNSDTRKALSRADLTWAYYRRKAGWTQKRIAGDLCVSIRTLQRHLPSLARPRAESTGDSLYLATLGGTQRLHAAHAIEDLWEILHHFVVTGKKPTLADLAKIRGDGEAQTPQAKESTRRAFYRMGEVLKANGVTWSLEHDSSTTIAWSEEQKIQSGDVPSTISFNVQQLGAFVKREINLAGRIIEERARRTGDTTRFRGR